MITGADHFVLLVNELNRAIETFRGLDFETSPGGVHPDSGTQNALVPLGDGTYLELLAFQDKGLAERSRWRDGVRRLGVHEGFGTFVLGSDNLANDIKPPRENGLQITDPLPGSRLRPDGQMVVWRSAFFDGSATGLMPFLIQDETPRSLRSEPPTQGLGVMARVNQVVVAVNNVESAQEKYRVLLSAEPRRVHNTDGDVEGYRFAADWGSIVLANSQRKGNAITDELAHRGEGLYSITLAFANLGDVWTAMKNRGIQLERDGNGYMIPPAAASGARIRLAQR